VFATETESWFIDSLEEWRKAKNLDNFILLGHSLGGYIAARYALKVLNFHTHKFSIAHHHHSLHMNKVLQSCSLAKT
jgi:pimeloyl-ACP methyl ester carboxylesterase